MNIHASGGEALRRRDEILRIVGHAPIHSQEELLGALAQRGYRVTQPTLSRDLRELGLAKSPSGYVAPATLQSGISLAPRERREQHLETMLRGAFLSAETAGNLVVLRTATAAAQPVASALDEASLPDVIGTIGGDDTIFVALRTPRAATALSRRLHEMAGAPTRTARR